MANPKKKALDKAKVSTGAKLEDIGYSITDHKGRILKEEKGRGRFKLRKGRGRDGSMEHRATGLHNTHKLLD